MAGWDLAVQLAPNDLPRFRQIASAIAADIARGRLRPGDKLTSSRALANQLGVSRNTVVAAYDELVVDGWIAIEPMRGAFIVGVPSERSLLFEAEPFPRVAGFDLPEALHVDAPAPRNGKLLLLLGGVPELRELPLRPLARAYRAALSGAKARRLVDYAHPQGNHELRAAIGRLTSQVRGIAAPTEAITIVRGSQHALYLAARSLLRPGDAVAVEALGYRPAWKALELAGATLVPIPSIAAGSMSTRSRPRVPRSASGRSTRRRITSIRRRSRYRRRGAGSCSSSPARSG